MDKAKFSHPGITEFVDTPASLLSRVPYLSPTECRAYVDLREFEDDRTVPVSYTHLSGIADDRGNIFPFLVKQRAGDKPRGISYAYD